MARLVSALSSEHWDLGSIPRSPIFSNEFCFHVISCSFKPRSSPYTQYPSMPHVSERPSKGPDLMNTILTSQRVHTRPGKSTEGLNSIGPNCWPDTSNLGQQTPHWFAFLTLFIFFFFYFYWFYLILISIL